MACNWPQLHEAMRWIMAERSWGLRRLMFELSGRRRYGAARRIMNQRASRRHAGGGPRSSEGLGRTLFAQALGALRADAMSCVSAYSVSSLIFPSRIRMTQQYEFSYLLPDVVWLCPVP